MRWDGVTVPCADPEALAAFWCGLLGVGVRGRWEQYVVLDPLAPGVPSLVLQRVDDLPAGPRRTGGHLDLHVPGEELDAAVARALGLGASDLGPVRQGGQRWHVLADPEGNPFCLVADA